MKVLNVNLHFYPESIGGATVVAEKLAWGLTRQGHEVTNVFLSLPPGDRDYRIHDTPFGRSVGIKNIPQTPANRFYSPAAASAFREIHDIFAPDRIFVHAVQHLGLHGILTDRSLLEKTTIIAHDFFWVCLQGFRRLPDGSDCHLVPGNAACRQCAWYPGLTDNIYATSRQIIEGSRAVVFPSEYLFREYNNIAPGLRGNLHVQANPDMAEMIIPPSAELPEPPGAAQKGSGKTIFGFVGGPGEAKGWSLVRDFMDRAEEMADQPTGPHVVLFDIGRSVGAPWYPGVKRPGVTIADPFHWSFAAHTLQHLDVMLMPSRVRESFGLAAREILSMGKACVLRPSGALSELAGYDRVVVVDENDDVDSILSKLSASDNLPKGEWTGTSIEDYADRLLAL